MLEQLCTGSCAGECTKHYDRNQFNIGFLYPQFYAISDTICGRQIQGVDRESRYDGSEAPEINEQLGSTVYFTSEGVLPRTPIPRKGLRGEMILILVGG